MSSHVILWLWSFKTVGLLLNWLRTIVKIFVIGQHDLLEIVFTYSSLSSWQSTGEIDNSEAKMFFWSRSSGFFRGPMTSKITSYFRQHNLCCILMHRMVMSYLVNLVVLAQKSYLPATSCISMLTGDEKEIFRTHRNHNQTQTVAKFVSTTQGATKVMNSLSYSKGFTGSISNKEKINRG